MIKKSVETFAAIVKPLRTRWVYEWEGWMEKRNGKMFLQSVWLSHLTSLL